MMPALGKWPAGTIGKSWMEAGRLPMATTPRSNPLWVVLAIWREDFAIQKRAL
jgi:hypothetical protein